MTVGLVLALLVGGVAACLVWARLHLVVVSVQGRSMEPTLRHGDRVLVRRRRAAVHTGQLVVMRRPPPWRTVDSWSAGRFVGAEGFPRPGTAPSAQHWIIKRVAAVGGEPLPPVLGVLADHLGPVVPAGHLLVLGDNPAASYDSRGFGYLPAESVLGVVTTRDPARR